MSKTVYWACQMLEKVNIEVLGRSQELPMQWHDGQLGVMLVFATREAAEAYSGGKSEILSGTIN